MLIKNAILNLSISVGSKVNNVLGSEKSDNDIAHLIHPLPLPSSTLASVDQKDGHTVKSAITDDAYLIIPKHYYKYPMAP
jgi:hypothetical protein